MGNTDAPKSASRGRKYVTLAERKRVLISARSLEPDQCLFIEMLAWTGARITEVLSLTAADFNLGEAIVTLPTLKRRRPITRDMPLPPDLVARLERHFRLSERIRDPARRFDRLWRFTRTTGWRIVKRLSLGEGIVGVRASPRGLRHGFGVGTLQTGVPVTLLRRWLGHARLSTTEIYADVAGPEEVGFARQFWERADLFERPATSPPDKPTRPRRR